MSNINNVKVLKTNQARVSYVLPTFTGFWQHGYTYIDSDACLKGSYIYKDLTTDPVATGYKSITSDPLPANCTWDTQIEVRDAPADHWQFFREFSVESWNTIMKTKAGPMMKVIIVWYTCPYVRHALHYQSLPIYDCPANTIYTYINGQGGLCATDAISCHSDVVGRDLNVKNFGFLGHVGITSIDHNVYRNDYKVIEVLNVEGNVLQYNSLESFRMATRYWGEKYHIAGKADFKLDDNSKIYSKAIQQRAFDMEYTLTKLWHPGSYHLLNIYDESTQTWKAYYGFTRAKFRCDTFVNYCFNSGLGLHIPASQFIMPRETYNSFLWRRDFAAAKNISQSVSKPQANNILNIIAQADIISDVLSYENININELDTAINNYLSNTSQTRKEKISFLWQQALLYQDNEEKMRYILDCLGQLRPIELAHELISTFHQQGNIRNKLKVLSVLEYTLQHQPSDKETSRLLQAHIHSVVTIQKFFLNLLQRNHHTLLTKRALWASSSLLPPTITYMLTKDALAHLDITIQNEVQYYMVQLGQVFSCADLQPTLLTLLQEIKHQAPSEQAFFNRALLTLLYYLEPQDLVATIQTPLLNYLENQKELIAAQSYNNTQYEAHDVKEHWLKAYNKIKLSSHMPKHYPIMMSLVIMDKRQGELTLANRNELTESSQTSSASSKHESNFIVNIIQSAASAFSYLGAFFVSPKALVSADNSQALIIHPKYPINSVLEGLFDDTEEKTVSTSKPTVSREPIIGTYVQHFYAQAALLRVGYEMGKMIYRWWTGDTKLQREAQKQAEIAAQKQFEALKQTYQAHPYAKIYFSIVKEPDILTVQEIEKGLASLTIKQIKQLAKLSQLATTAQQRFLQDLPETLANEILEFADDAYNYCIEYKLFNYTTLKYANNFHRLSCKPNSISVLANNKVLFWTQPTAAIQNSHSKVESIEMRQNKTLPSLT